MVCSAGLLLSVLFSMLGTLGATRLRVKTAARLAAGLLVLPWPWTPPAQASPDASIIEAFVELPESSRGSMFLLQVLGGDELVAGAKLRVETTGLFRLQLFEDNLLVPRDEWERRSGESLLLRGQVCREVRGRECESAQLGGESSARVVQTRGGLTRITPAIVLR